MAAADRNGVGVRVNRVASLLTVFFASQPVTDYQSARQADTSLFGRFFHQLLSGGVYWPPSQFEAAFVSLAHTDGDIQSTLKVMDRALASLKPEK